MLRPTFAGFNVARQAINISQAGLDTVGHNIANLSTPGFTRQRVQQSSMHMTVSTQFQVHGSGGQVPGQGVMLNGIQQIRDPFLDNRFRTEASNNGELAVRQAGLADIERLIDEIATTGLHSSMLELIDQISRFAQNADSNEIAVVVRNAAMALTQVFNRTAQDLENALAHQKFDMQVAVENEVNIILEQIGHLNGRIREANLFGNPANELNDERNVLLDRLSSFLPIQVVREPDPNITHMSVERLTIRLGSGPTAPVLVDNTKHNALQLTFNEDNGFARIALLEGASGFVLPGMEDITNNITGGGLRGFLDIINGVGEFAGPRENQFRGIPYYQRNLDLIAQTFAQMMNNLNSISVEDATRMGLDPPTAQNRPLFAPNLQPEFISQGGVFTDRNGDSAFFRSWAGAGQQVFWEDGTPGGRFYIRDVAGNPIPSPDGDADMEDFLFRGVHNGSPAYFTFDNATGLFGLVDADGQPLPDAATQLTLSFEDAGITGQVFDPALLPPSEIRAGAEFELVTAANITLSAQWVAESSWFTTTKQPPSSELVALTRPNPAPGQPGHIPVGGLIPNPAPGQPGHVPAPGVGDAIPNPPVGSPGHVNAVETGPPQFIPNPPSTGTPNGHVSGFPVGHPVPNPGWNADPALIDTTAPGHVASAVPPQFIRNPAGGQPGHDNRVPVGHPVPNPNPGQPGHVNVAIQPVFVGNPDTEWANPPLGTPGHNPDFPAGEIVPHPGHVENPPTHIRNPASGQPGHIGGGDPIVELDPEGNRIYRTASNTDNILLFLNLLRSDSVTFSAPGVGGPETSIFRGTFLESFTSKQSTLGLDVSANMALLEASDLIVGTFADQRDAISAVSMDEEAVNMMVFQNHYNAAARFLTVLDEALGTIIERMGVVGR